MTEIDRFKVEQVIKQIEVKLRTEPNSCEYDYYKRLKEELLEKLRE